MNAIEHYLQELAANLHVRGTSRRRFLSECADHLRDAAAERGVDAAVAAFGGPATIAAQFDAEVALRRSVRSTYAVVAGVATIAGSTLALIHWAAPGAAGGPGSAGAFFACAQTSAAAALLAVLQALALRRSAGPASASDLSLLARRNACALIAAALTMLVAGVALPGEGSAPLLLAGPLLVCTASFAVLRARSLTHRLDGSREPAQRSPLDDVALLTGLPVPTWTPSRLLALVTVVAALGAGLRDHLERASAGQAVVTGGVEAVAVVAGFVLLGGMLGIRRALVSRA